MNTKTPYWRYCTYERIAAAMYDCLRAAYHPHTRQLLDAELRRHACDTVKRHWKLYPHSLEPVLWTSATCKPLTREHTLEEQILLRKLGIWETRHTFARYLGYDDELEFLHWLERDFRQTLWKAVWKTRPRT